MNISYREWDTSGIIIECGGRKFVVAPEDLVLPDDKMTRSGLFEQGQAKEINRNLASGWNIPTYEQMLEMVEVCKGMKNGRSYWTDNAEDAYNPASGRCVPRMDIEQEMVLCKIRCVCDLCSAME